MASGSRSSPASAVAGSPGRSCCSPKIRTETKNSVGTIVASRRSRKRSISIHLQALNANHPIGHGTQPGQLGVVRPQPVAVKEVDDGAVLRHVLRHGLVELGALSGV